MGFAFGLVSNPVLYLGAVLGLLVQFLLVAGSWLLQLVFFLYFLLVMLNNEDDMLGMGITILVPTGPAHQSRLANTLRSAVEGVFFLPMQVGLVVCLGLRLACCCVLTEVAPLHRTKGCHVASPCGTKWGVDVWSFAQ